MSYSIAINERMKTMTDIVTRPRMPEDILPFQFDGIGPRAISDTLAYRIDEEVRTALLEQHVAAAHAGWSFNGAVWHQDGRYYCDVYQFHAFRTSHDAETLEDLLAEVNAHYGESAPAATG